MSDREAAIRERLEFGLRTKLPAERGTKWKQALHDLNALLAELAAAREQNAWHKSTKQALMDAHEAAVRREAKLREAIAACIGDAEGQEAVERRRMLELTKGQVQLLARALADGEGEKDDAVYGDWRDNPGNYGE